MIFRPKILIKTVEQIDGIRKSCHLAADALTMIEEHIKPGVTTESLNRKIEEFIRSYGGVPAPLNYLGYPKATCISLNEVICHGIPNDVDFLKEGDILNVDVTTILDGFYGDTSRMFAVGEVSDAARAIMSAAKDCLDIGVSQVKPGNKFGDIGRAISSYARSRGYSIVHQFCGHGTGVNFHEPPQIHHDDRSYLDVEMKPGMVFTIEPMINQGVAEAVIDSTDKWTARTKDGLLSAQWEHTLVVTDDSFEILTSFSDSL